MASPRIRREKLLRLVVLLAVVVFLPSTLLLDLYIVPWAIPTTVLYALPVILAARYLSERVAIIVLVGAVLTEVLDGWLKDAALGTQVLASPSLIAAKFG